jgi:hypothetical protein
MITKDYNHMEQFLRQLLISTDSRVRLGPTGLTLLPGPTKQLSSLDWLIS